MSAKTVSLLTIIQQGASCGESAALARNAMANGETELAGKYAEQMRASLRDYAASLEAYIAPHLSGAK